MEQQVNIITSGRRDIQDLFRLHVGVWKELKLSPLLVFVKTHNEVTKEVDVRVVIVTKPIDLLIYPDDTPVMAIWPGQWRSDFFQFSVGEWREYLSKKAQLPLDT